MFTDMFPGALYEGPGSAIRTISRCGKPSPIRTDMSLDSNFRFANEGNLWK